MVALSRNQALVVFTLLLSLLMRTMIENKMLFVREASKFFTSSLNETHPPPPPVVLAPGASDDQLRMYHQHYTADASFNNSESLIHDKTLLWDSSVHRPWTMGTRMLDDNNSDENNNRNSRMTGDYSKQEMPPAMIVLTNYGWNHPNQTAVGLNVARSVRNTELLTGIINHAWFHPTFWEDYWQEDSNHSIDSSRKKDLARQYRNVRIYVFSDLPQCEEGNYPNYGQGRNGNLDLQFNRSIQTRIPGNDLRARVLQMNREMHYNLSSSRKQVLAVEFDCRGTGGKAKRASRSERSHIAFASYSAMISDALESLDQGLPPPACKPADLSPNEMHDIDTCDAETKRKFYVTYAGNYRSGRNGLFHKQYGGARGSYQALNDNKRIFVTRYFKEEFQQSALSKYSYEDGLRQSVFALAPRGDNKFSYRFQEVMSAGAIPVVHADDWIWPFRPDLVNWTECAVILPEKDAGQYTIDYLDRISLEDRCRMRQACQRIYQHYMVTPVHVIDGLIQGLERTWSRYNANETLRLLGVRCDSFQNRSACNMQRRV